MVVTLVKGYHDVIPPRLNCTFGMEFTTKVNHVKNDGLQVQNRLCPSQIDAVQGGDGTNADCFPALHKRKFHGSLKRFRGAYLRRTSGEFSHGPSTSKSTEKAVQLPGIGDGRRRKTLNSGKCSEIFSVETGCISNLKGAADSNSPGRVGEMGGGSETGSESRTSGNGGTSPRRKIRVPTPFSRTRSFMASRPPSFDPQNIFPRPPDTPRGFPQKKSSVIKAHSVSNVNRWNIDSNNSTNYNETEIIMRPKTPALRKTKMFKTTLQNIHHRCKKEELDEQVNQHRRQACKSRSLRSSKIATPESTSTSPRRKSTGDPIDERGDWHSHRAKFLSRRLSMPGDLQEARERTCGIEFINVGEYSRDFIQQLLVRRETRSSARVVGDDLRQRKCLSWLQSLEQS